MAPNVFSTHKISVTLSPQGGLSYVHKTHVYALFFIKDIVSVSLLNISSRMTSYSSTSQGHSKPL